MNRVKPNQDNIDAQLKSTAVVKKQGFLEVSLYYHALLPQVLGQVFALLHEIVNSEVVFVGVKLGLKDRLRVRFLECLKLGDVVWQDESRRCARLLVLVELES